MGKLTPKQQRFVNEYIVDLNATQAAIRAGYSEKTAKSQGQRLLTNVDIQAATQKAMGGRSERTEVTADRVVLQLAKIAFADIRDVATWEEKEIVVAFDKKAGKPIKERVLKVEVKPSEQVDGTILSEVSETINNQGRKVAAKLNDRMKALELLGRHLGMFTDKLEMRGSGTIVVKVPEEMED